MGWPYEPCFIVSWNSFTCVEDQILTVNEIHEFKIHMNDTRTIINFKISFHFDHLRNVLEDTDTMKSDFFELEWSKVTYKLTIDHTLPTYSLGTPIPSLGLLILHSLQVLVQVQIKNFLFSGFPAKFFWNRCQISLLILCKFRQINYFRSPLKSSANRRLIDWRKFL